MNTLSNPLLQGERESQRPTSWWGALLFFLFVNLLFKVGFGLFVSAIGLIDGDPKPPISFGTQLVMLLTFLPDYFWLALWVKRKEKRPFSSIGFRDIRRGGVRFATGLMTGVLSMFLLAGIIAAAGGFRIGAPVPGMHVGVHALLPVLVLVTGFIVQGSSEEVFARGFLLPIGANRVNLIFGVLWQAIVFMAMHLLNGHITLLPIVNLVLVAIMLALVALKEGSLWLVCGWHAGWNWCQSNILGIPVSGLQVGNCLVFVQPTPKSSHVLTGGEFGVEGSIITTIFLLVCSVVYFVLLRRSAMEPAVAPAAPNAG